MLNGPFAPWPNFTQAEADAVSRVLLSNKVNYWTGTEGREFETEFAAFAGTDHAIVVANGTVALDLALHGLRIGAHNGGLASDRVIVTPRSFIASASAIINAGAIPVFADVCPDSGNITPETVEPLICANTRAILCVHLAGWPCDMDGFRALAAPKKGIHLIEDCAQAHGAQYNGRPVGSLGDVAAWSFCQDKIMTTGGEGGMVTCNDPELWRRMWAFKDHGKSWEAVYERQHPIGFRWLHESVGTNWRMTEMQSVIGRIQLGRMAEWHAIRTANADIILNAARAAGLRVPEVPATIRHGFYKAYAYAYGGAKVRDAWLVRLSEQGIPAISGICPEIWREKAFQALDRPYLPVARDIGASSIMFMVHPGMDARRMAEAIQTASP